MINIFLHAFQKEYDQNAPSASQVNMAFDLQPRVNNKPLELQPPQPPIDLQSVPKQFSNNSTLATFQRVIAGVNKNSAQSFLVSTPSPSALASTFENKNSKVCYANALIQALFHVPSVFNMVTSVKKYDNETMWQLLLLFHKMNRKETPLSIKDLLETLIDKHGKVELKWHNEQNDPSELFVRFSLEFTINLLSLFTLEVSRIITCSVCNATKESENNPLETFLGLSVHGNNVLDSINHFFEKEKLEFKCDKCNSNTCCESSTTLKQVPKVLILYLKRYEKQEDGTIVKTSKEQSFNETLRLFDSYTFTLRSVVYHMGSETSNGHYACFAKEGDSWINFNDSIAKSVTFNIVQNQSRDGGVLFCYTLDSEYENEKQKVKESFDVGNEATTMVVEDLPLNEKPVLQKDTPVLPVLENNKISVASTSQFTKLVLQNVEFLFLHLPYDQLRIYVQDKQTGIGEFLHMRHFVHVKQSTKFNYYHYKYPRPAPEKKLPLWSFFTQNTELTISHEGNEAVYKVNATETKFNIPQELQKVLTSYKHSKIVTTTKLVNYK